MQGFTPRPVNQKGAQGKDASRGITNGSARQRRRRGEMYRASAELLDIYYEDYERR